MPADKPRKHHYLPQFYLKGFAGEDCRLFQCERRIGKLVTTTVGDAATRKDFHRFEDVDSSFDPFAAEKMLAKVEGIQAEFLQQAMDNPELLGTDLALRAEILGLLQTMFFRVPKIHTMIANSSRKTLEARIRVMEKNGGFEDMPDELKRHLNGRSISAVVQPKLKNWFLILSMLQLGTEQALYKLLWPMNVAVLVAKGFRGFIAGDAAVAIYDRRHGRTTNKAAGFASPTVEFSFPLSSQMLLLVGREVRPGVLNVSDDEVLQFNQRTIVWSERFLFAETFDALTLRDIMALSDRQAGFSAENFDASDGIYTLSRMNPVYPSLLDVS